MTVLRALLAALVAGAGLVLVASAPAFACDCATADARHSVKQADLVLVGEVTEVTPPPAAEMMSSSDPATYTLAVDAVFKGASPATLDVLSPVSGASCGLEGVEEGRDYLVFAAFRDIRGKKQARPWAFLCGGTAPASAVEVAEVEAVTGPATTAEPDAPQPHRGAGRDRQARRDGRRSGRLAPASPRGPGERERSRRWWGSVGSSWGAGDNRAHDLRPAGEPCTDPCARRWAPLAGRSLMTAQRVLVTGASGFVGSALTTALVGEGHDVLAMTRRPEQYDGAGRPVAADVRDAAAVRGALEGVDVAYYLIHSLDSARFEREDAAYARTFSRAAADAGVRQIIYLGGLGRDEAALSPHLRSRREVESLLGSDGVPVTVLRAAVVVGHNGISWEMTRQLAGTVPLMPAPHWVRTRIQPISLQDVVAYLVGVLGNEKALGRVFEVGGPTVLTYADMLTTVARLQKGRDVAVVPVPVVGGGLVDGLVARASSHFLALTTGTDAATGRNLIGSMEHEVVVTDDAIRGVVDLEPLDFEDMVRVALGDRLREGLAP